MADAGAARLSAQDRDALSPVAERLQRAQRHAWAGNGLRVASVAVAVAAAAYVVARLAVPALASGPWRGAAAAGAIGAVVLAVAWTASRSASLASLARSADRVFGTQERISTAWEVAAKGGTSPLERALIADAVARARQLEPHLLAPIPWRRCGALVVVSLLAAGAALVLLPGTPDRAVIAAGADLDRPLDQQERAEVAERLVAARDLVARDAASLDDPYLNALGRELERVAAEIASGEIATRTAARDELSRLSSYAADGYARVAGQGSDAGEVARSLGDAMAALGSPGERDDGMAGGAPPPAADGAPAQAAADAAAGVRDAGPSFQDGGGAGGVSTANQAPRGAASGDGEARMYEEGDCLHAGDLDCFLISEPTNAPSVLLERVGDQAAQGQPNSAAAGAPPTVGFRLGASSRSGAGESFEAGRGAATIGGGEAADPGGFAAGAEVGLAAGRRSGEQNSIRIDRAPEPGAGGPAAEGADAGGLAWRRLEEAPVSRNRTTPGQRDAIARYFRPDAD